VLYILTVSLYLDAFKGMNGSSSLSSSSSISEKSLTFFYSAFSGSGLLWGEPSIVSKLNIATFLWLNFWSEFFVFLTGVLKERL
jgi:hypothetical protein